MSGALYELEELLATLLAQHIPDERTQRVDVVPQLGVLRSKLDFEARGAHGKLIPSVNPIPQQV